MGILLMIKKDLKILRVDFGESSDLQHPKWLSRTLWDVDPQLDGDEALYMANTTEDPEQFPHYQGWRVVRYLSLERKGTYATSITVSFTRRGINDVTVSGKPALEVGSSAGIVKHFHIRPGEYISFVAFVTKTFSRSVVDLPVGVFFLVSIGYPLTLTLKSMLTRMR